MPTVSADAVGVAFQGIFFPKDGIRPLRNVYRFALGRTNFNAVCVAEKLTTFTSTKPARRPVLITCSPVISCLPLG